MTTKELSIFIHKVIFILLTQQGNNQSFTNLYIKAVCQQEKN